MRDRKEIEADANHFTNGVGRPYVERSTLLLGLILEVLLDVRDDVNVGGNAAEMMRGGLARGEFTVNAVDAFRGSRRG